MKLPFSPKPNFWRTYAAIVITGLGITLFAYIGIQQSVRLGANHQPIQKAIDVVGDLGNGTTPADAVGTQQRSETATYSTFATVVDRNFNILASSGSLFTGTPLPPHGAFTYSLGKKGVWRVNTFTWQQANGTRYAAAIYPYSYAGQSGYVLAAQQLKPAEDIISNLTTLFFLTCIGVVLAPALLLLSLE